MANPVISEQAFLDLLTEIQRNSPSMVMTQSYDIDKVINVDLNTREIELKDTQYKNLVGVDRDHYAETLYFKVPRYFDDVDLYRMAVVVEYVNAKGSTYIAPILVRDIRSFPGYMVCAWNVHGNATITAGSLTFALRFFQMEPSDHTIVYSLRTKPVTAKVAKGLPAQDAATEGDLINTHTLDEVVSEIVNNTTIWWNNL